VVIELRAHSKKNSLSKVALQEIDEVLEESRQDHGCQIEPAIQKQGVQIPQSDGRIDDPLLHF